MYGSFSSFVFLIRIATEVRHKSFSVARAIYTKSFILLSLILELDACFLVAIFIESAVEMSWIHYVHFVCVLFTYLTSVKAGDQYSIGTGRYDITGPSVEIGMVSFIFHDVAIIM